MAPTEEFVFLEEKPLKTPEEISNSKFGHEEIAITLANVVKKAPTPFTVGLFAKWGSGKSTVANALKQSLPVANVPVILFDVWKHEGDALRRTFLKEMIRQLKEYGDKFFESDFQLDERVEQSVTRSSDSRFKFRSEEVKQAWPYFVIIGCLVVIAGCVAAAFGNLQLFETFLVSLTGFTGGAALIMWIIKNSLQLFTTETVSYGVDKFEDPHQFEEEFVRVLKALKNPRVLIIFDNLDRVDHDKVAEVLSTIKTFLEPADIINPKREVVFLIPCDAKAIKQHLSNIYGSSEKFTFDPDEFLRKFFNTIVWIPDFIPSELEAFARTSLQKTKVTLLDNDYVAWIITKAFRNNPRQVIQFVNILLANYLLVKEREGEDKDFPAGFLSENIPQLTKYLILNQLFPDEMEILREKKILDLQDIKKEDVMKNADGESDFLSFVGETKNIPIKNLRIFFTLRRSEQEKKFPGFDSFIALLEDQKIEESKKLFSQLGDFSKANLKDDFSQAIKKELESTANPVSSANLIYSLFSILSETKISLADTLYEEINNILGDRCKEHLQIIRPALLEEILLSRNASYRSAIITQWISLIQNFVTNGPQVVDNKFIEQVFSIFSKHPDYLTTAQKGVVKTLLSANLASNVEVAKAMTANPEAQKSLLSIDYIKNFITAIPVAGNLNDIAARLTLMDAFSADLLKRAGPDLILEKFTLIQNTENQSTKPNPPPERAKLISPIRKFISSQKSLVTTATNPSKDNFVDSLITGFNAVPTWDPRIVFVPILYEFRGLVTAPKLAVIDGALNGFLANAVPASIDQAFAELSEADRKTLFDTNLYTAAENRAINDLATRVALFSKFSDSRKVEFLKKLTGSNLDQSLQFMESLDLQENKNIFIAFEKVWEKFDPASPEQKQKILKFVNGRSAGDDDAIRETLVSKISNCLLSIDVALQQVGLTALTEGKSHLSDSQKRKIAKDCFDWLRKPETTAKYQPNTIKAILSELGHFNVEERKEFTHFLFDDIIRKAIDPVQVVEGFAVLKSVAPKYEERKENFDDIKAKIEAEQNDAIKKALISGLLTLKPSQQAATNQEFWSWAESVQPKEPPQAAK